MDSFDSWQGDYAALLGSDVSEAVKMAPFAPRVQGAESAPWWQGVVQYGLVKAIDNTLPGRAPGIQGNTNPGSFAGQNGATYTQAGPLTQAPAQASRGGFLGLSTPMLLLLGLGLAGAAFVAFKD